MDSTQEGKCEVIQLIQQYTQKNHQQVGGGISQFYEEESFQKSINEIEKSEITTTPSPYVVIEIFNVAQEVFIW